MKVGYVKTSYVDYPGRLSSVIFFPLCNYRCAYCHNKELVEGEVQNGLELEEVLQDIEKRKELVNCVVVSGGEALLHSKEVEYILRWCKERGMQTKLDTNGSRPKELKNLLSAGLLDFVAVDVKTLGCKYELITSKTAEGVLESIKEVVQHNVDMLCRTTVFRGLHSKEDLIQICARIPANITYILQRGKYMTAYPCDVEYAEYTVSEVEELQQFVLKLRGERKGR